MSNKVSFAFPKKNRLLKRRDFLRLQANGIKLFSRSFLIFLQPLGEASLPSDSKVGITVSKKVARDSNKRNLVRRRVRECCRLSLLPDLKAGLEFVIVVKISALTLSFQEIQNELIKLFSKKNLIENK